MTYGFTVRMNAKIFGLQCGHFEVVQQVRARFRHDGAARKIRSRDLEHPTVRQLRQELPEAHGPSALCLRKS
jgi:hypothetical protein